MRIDKFLKVSGIMKRRTIANQACEGGRVSINGKSAKPSHSIKEGDVVELGLNSGKVAFRILKIKETVRKEEAPSLYEIIEE